MKINKQETSRLLSTEISSKIITRLKTGYVLFEEDKSEKGQCVFLSSVEVASIDDLDYPKRKKFLNDMRLVGEAVKEIFNAKRIDYSILSKTSSSSFDFLHALIFPKYKLESSKTEKEFSCPSLSNKSTKEELEQLKNKIEELKEKAYN